jgi:Carboxypeptidase regulatory-like domain
LIQPLKLTPVSSAGCVQLSQEYDIVQNDQVIYRSVLSPCRFLLIVPFVIAACSGDKSIPIAPTPPAPTTATLSGTITDASTGAPLSGATLTIGDGPNANRTVTSEPNGSYRLQNLAVSGFSFVVRREGYDDYVQGIGLTADTVLNIQLARTRLNLTGNDWRGTFSVTVNGTQGTREIQSATISQNGTAVTGTFRTTGNWSGNFTGTLTSEFQDARISGTLQTSAPSVSGTVICNSSGTFTGTAFPSLNITAPVLVSQNCTGTISNGSLALTR